MLHLGWGVRKLSGRSGRFGAIGLLCWGLAGAATSPSGTSDETAKVTESLVAEFAKGLRAIDSDGDGNVETSALMRMLRQVGYGKAAPIQRGRGGGQDPAERFASLDADGDGRLTGEEPGPYMRGTAYFEDGVVTKEEYLKAWQALGARRGGGGRGGRGGGRRGGSQSEGGSRFGAVQSGDVEFITGLDSNKDGTLTQKEVRAAIEADVADNMRARTTLDANGDGSVTPKEYALSQPSRGGETDEHGLDGHSRGHFEREDANHDGVISMKEIADRVEAGMSRRIRGVQLALRMVGADADGDGALSASELKTLSSANVFGALGAAPFQLTQLYPKLYPASVEATAAIDRAIP